MTRYIYLHRRKQLIKYLLDKVKQNDFHGVADAAMDIRELDAFWKGQLEGRVS